MKYAPFFLALAFALSPFLTDSFGGFAPDAFPVPQEDPPTQPAGYAFAIWGLIYLWLIVHGAVGTRRDNPDWGATRLPLSLSLGVGVFWIPVANLSPIWATVLIWIMLGTALAALLRAGRSEPLLLDTPLGLYAGWLTAASSVSLGLLAGGWGLTGPVPAAILAILVALVVGLVILSRRPSWGYTAALIWALVALVVQNLGTSPLVAGLSGLGALAVLGYQFKQSRA
ncbi:hypothetical protein [Palleronia caenipelagi]|uniref:Tryptophan-rich sensory protein n=1 Tax=Palleronia caenipelagi TaxID=2489174 RepID=A0A547Q335_9RHOB|nr:hypothetical protein [Palleronia caenipelagi]TRD20797.1 hypothetical protein FEV53_09225 [Palleronia caenipelagi]